MITDQDINKLAELSRLSLTDSEKTSFPNEIDAILGYVSKIDSLGSGEVIPRFEQVNILRDDVVIHKPNEYTDKLLANAPQSEDGYVKVKKILG